MKIFTTTLALALVCGLCHADLPTSDDFNAASEDTAKWSPDLIIGHGALSQINSQLEFRVDGAAALDQSFRPWKPTRGPYDADWEIQVDTFNSLTPTGTTNQQIAVGISIDDSRAIVSHEIIAVQVAGTAFSPQPYTLFMGRLGTASNGTFVSSSNLSVTNGAVRAVFTSATKVITLYYDLNPTNGYTWTQFASFGVNGAGGTDTNADWGMTESDQFKIGVYGFALHSDVPAGTVAADNFDTTGLVAPLVPHNFAVTSLKAPKKVTLQEGKTPKPGKVSLAIQNQGTVTETIPDMPTLQNLVNLDIESLGLCATPTVTITPPKAFPVVLGPKKSLKLSYLVDIICANNPDAGLGNEDYRYAVTVDPAALDGGTDTVPANNVCPRPANPDTGDKGCGNKDAITKQIGADVLTDVVMK